MSRFVLTPAAKQDLREIRRYIGQNNINAALRLVAELKSKCRELAGMPFMGAKRPDLADERHRVFPVGSYLIVYRPETKPLQIIRFWHSARGTPEIP